MVLNFIMECSPLSNELWNRPYDSWAWGKKEWSRTHSRQLAHRSPNLSTPGPHFNTCFRDRFFYDSSDCYVSCNQSVVRREVNPSKESKCSFKNKASVWKAASSLDGHLANWVTLLEDRICIWANQGHSPHLFSHIMAAWKQKKPTSNAANSHLWAQKSV